MLPILFTIPRLAPERLPQILLLLACVTALLAVVAARRGGRESLQFVLVGGAAAAGISVALSRGAIPVHAYGVLLMIGFAAGTFNACLEAKRRGLDPNLVLDIMLPMLLVTVAMCRVVYILLNRENFHGWREMLQVWNGGLSFHGVFPGSIAVVGYFAVTRKIRFGTIADVLAPSVFLGYVFGRIGCLLNGCCYGHACDLPWAVVFPVEGGPLGQRTLPSHPTQLYSALLALGLFAFMQRAKVSEKFNLFPGQLTLLFFALYAVERFFIEFFRAGATARFLFGSPLTEAQFVSIFGLLVIAGFWLGLARKAKAAVAS